MRDIRKIEEIHQRFVIYAYIFYINLQHHALHENKQNSDAPGPRT